MATYQVQVNDGGEWLDCIREDLLEDFDGETAALPSASFQTREDAEQFILTLCGLMHCGGNPADFRVVVSQ